MRLSALYYLSTFTLRQYSISYYIITIYVPNRPTNAIVTTAV